MATSTDSDDEEMFVTLGTPLDVPDEDEPRRKPVSVQDIQARDNKGRARFHGAFTGGYSAGYFNTVGSEKGWTPSSFVSSRSKRAETSDQQKPEDFMDEEDLGEFGIAPRRLVTAGTFSSEERKRRRQDELKATTSDAIIPGDLALINLIIPERITIGVKLLRKMGWKEGQGIGPRLSKKQKKREKAGMKVYGCEMPPSPDSDANDLDDETFLSDVTYAPKDNTQIFLSVKTNTHGLGYRGLDPQSALPSSHVQLFDPPRIKKTGRKGIRGQAFGVGALEEEDDDIYGVEDMSNYDMTMGDEGQDSHYGWTAPRSRGPVQTPVGYVGELLEGFKLSSVKLVQTKLFPPPELPRGYRPVHTFSKPEESEPTQPSTDYYQAPPSDTYQAPAAGIPSASAPDKTKSYSDATSRSVALGEQAFVGSVFDLISKEDKDRIAVSKFSKQPQEASKTSDNSGNQQSSDQSLISSNKGETFSNVEEQRRKNVPLFQGGAEFKPFVKNPQKQERYDRYLALVKQGHRDPYAAVRDEGQTEWEAEREREEFSKAAHLYKPLATMMAMRFTSGSQHDEAGTEAGQQQPEAAKSDALKAAEMKMYGKLTREVLEWHPDRLVCKRFNVPDPYPGSNIVGLSSVKRDKYSVFNFLDFASSNREVPSLEYQNTQNPGNTTESEKNDKTSNADSKVDKKPNKSKPMKSIFSHLVEPQSTAAAKKTGVSFTLKGGRAKQDKEFKSIFSHLDGDEDQTARKPLPMETDANADAEAGSDEKQTEKNDSNNNVDQPDDNEKAKPEKESSGMDLFRAIFKNTDSEDSSESDEEIQVDQTISASGSKDTAQPSPVSHTQDKPKQDVQEQQPHDALLGVTSDSNVTVPPATTLPGSSERLPSLVQRLAPDDDSSDSESYGPALPPSHGQGSSIEAAQNTSVTYIDLTKVSSKKHRHKDRHKAKKDKKEKHKKSKHKKKHKKKDSKKKKRQRHESSDTTDTSDKDSDSDPEEMPSDRDLLNRMKMLKPGRSAADFF